MPSLPSDLVSKDDFQRYCAGLRRTGHELDDMVEALRALAASSLRTRDKTRFARRIARALSESFHPAQVRAVASVPWPPEIARVLERHVPPLAISDEATASDPQPPRTPPPETPVTPSSPLGTAVVVLVGEEREHLDSLPLLTAQGLRGVCVATLHELHEAFAREPVAGLVVGATAWFPPSPEGPSARQRLERILQLSNLCWIKLVRSPAWAEAGEHLDALCTQLYGAVPPRNRLVVEDLATLTPSELRGLADAIVDITYAERQVDYAFAPSIPQDRIVRAVSSRVLRDKPAIHALPPRLHVRALASRSPQRLVGLVSVEGTDLSYVLKVSPYPDARQEARRFGMIAHGTSFELKFFCHGALGALVFAPVGTRLGHARSLDDLLGMHDPVAPLREDPGVPHRGPIEAAIAALRRFCEQVKPADATTFCTVEHEDTQARLRRLEHLEVAGDRIDLGWLYREAVEVLVRCSRGAVVHGDAHPGNVLFSSTGAAILVDFECAGLGPPCLDLCTLWISALASHFVALGSEAQVVALLHSLLGGTPFEQLAHDHAAVLRLPVNYDVVYLASEAMKASTEVMRARGFGPGDVLGVVAMLLGRELHNPQLQQLVVRAGLAATWSLLQPA